MKMLHMIAFVLVVIGGLNWGLVGLLDMNLVSSLLGGSGLEKLVYTLVGVSTIYVLSTHMQDCKICSKK